MIEKIAQILGGKARAEKLSPERRAEIAKKAAAARWDKKAAAADSKAENVHPGEHLAQHAPAPKVSTTVDIPEPAPTQPARAPEPPEQPRLPPGATWDLDRVLARDPFWRAHLRRKRLAYVFD
jgi:hypothetical protein